MRSPVYRPAGLPAHGTQRGGRYQTPSAQRRFCRGALARLAVAEVSGPGGPGWGRRTVRRRDAGEAQGARGAPLAPVPFARGAGAQKEPVRLVGETENIFASVPASPNLKCMEQMRATFSEANLTNRRLSPIDYVH